MANKIIITKFVFLQDVLAFLVSCTNGYFGEYILPNIKNYYRTTKPRYYLKVSKKGCYFKNVSHENKYFLPEKVRARVNKKMYYKRYLLRVEYEEMPNNNDEANFSDGKIIICSIMIVFYYKSGNKGASYKMDKQF